MTSSYKIINLETFGVSARSSFATDVLEGLSASEKSLPTHYLYDERGSHLFEKISTLPEYYPTACEMEILRRRKEDISRIASHSPFRLVELGVGDAKKTKVLLQEFIQHGLHFTYIPVDICQEMVEQLVMSLKQEYGGSPMDVLGLVADYSAALEWLGQENSIPTIVLFLGSSIGNFTPDQTKRFLLQMWNGLCDRDCVFIGFDLKKDIHILEKAYRDSSGVTREFNLNLLDRINRELEGDFNRDSFMHHSFYNPAHSRMESWLVSTKAQTVIIGKLQRSFQFRAWEGIHIENSYKYDFHDIQQIGQEVGFDLDEALIDSKGYFAEVIWQVKKAHHAPMELNK